MIAIVRGAGIPENKLRTDSSNTQPIYTYENNPATGQNTRLFKGYRVQTNVDVTISDTTKLADLMDQITGAGFEKGANTEWGNLLNLYYTISNPDAIRDDIMIEAIANAKSKAQRMATAAGAELARVHQIIENGTPQFTRYPMPMMAMAKGGVMMDAAEAVAPPAGEQALSATVTVVYELK
ncbi:MAG: SIMPL domain-containing protein [Rickettsiales bacterium]